MIEIITGIIKEIFFLYKQMSPYLLLGMTVAGIMHVFISKDIIIKHLGKSNFLSVIKASLFGVPLPLCSCGVIPTAVYMNDKGASKASVISFLLSTPQTGVDSIIATYGMLGPIFAVFRPLAALVMGICGGIVTIFVDREKTKTLITTDEQIKVQAYVSIKAKIKTALSYGYFEFLDDIIFQFLLGLTIAGIVTYFIPDNFFQNSYFASGVPAMLLMIIIGIPIYLCATASIPVAIAILAKGFSAGAAYAFLAAGPVTNIATLAIISRVLGKKLTITYLGVVIIFSLVLGLVLDKIFMLSATSPIPVMNITAHFHSGDNCGILQLIKNAALYIFSAIFLYTFLRKIINKFFKISSHKIKPKNSKTALTIKGMNCSHCAGNVRECLEKTKGITSVEVDLENEIAYIEGEFDRAALKERIKAIGYTLLD